MTATILRGDALHLPLADETVDLVVTSPPYFALRSYQDGGEHYAGQIGSEASPQLWLEALWAATAEMARVLKPSGSIFVNLGDKYAGGNNGPQGGTAVATDFARSVDPVKGLYRSYPQQRWGGTPNKSLLLLPERYRIGAVDRLGLIARAVIIWDKPNGLPESVTDRVRRSHEDWVHLTKQPRYYSAVDEIREPHIEATRPGLMTWEERKARGEPMHGGQQGGLSFGAGFTRNPLGKLPGSVWCVPSEPLQVPPFYGVLGGKTAGFFWTEADGIRWMRRVGRTDNRPSLRKMEDHFAAYPTEWPRRIIAGWSPPGICTACGEGRRPVVQRRLTIHRGQFNRTYSARRDGVEPNGNNRGMNGGVVTGHTEATITGYACACTPHTNHPGTGESSGDGYSRPDGTVTSGLGYPQTGYSTELHARPKVGPVREYHFDRWTPVPTRPAIVLDPFAGTGTTILVADILGRHGIGVDLSADYCRLAAWRTTDPDSRAKAARVDKPPPVMNGQLDLLGGVW